MAAFLRGVNLGKRQVKNTDLVAAFGTIGLGAVKPLLASGNVLFDAEPRDTLGRDIERALRERFGFEVAIVLRTRDELLAMIASDPFGGMKESEAAKLHAILLAAVPADPLALSDVPAHLEIARIDPREVFIIAHRLPNGRYTEGMETIGGFPKGAVATARNWNTILKAAAP